MTLQADITAAIFNQSDAHAADHFDRVAELLDGRAPLDCVACPATGDDEGVVLVAATLLSSHFHLLCRLSVSNVDRRTHVDALDDHAVRIGGQVEGLSIGALGAMTMLVESTVCNDVSATGETLAAALDLFDLEELFDAAAVLMAAMIHVIAERLSLDVAVVHAEMRDGVDMVGQQYASERANGSDASVDRCDAVRSAARRGPVVRPVPTWLDQTCSGRNSQCHGSRGTDSTQPNLGPFVLSH